MPRAADAKVWNEDLVMALKAREEMARRQGKPSAHTWLQGWKAIQAVRGDIYAFKNGRIVNLPSPKLGKTVDNLCRAIIAGQAPLRPDGYVEHVVGQAVEGNPYLNDPYCNRIKKRGGAYAILLAFYVSPHNQVLTKDQICEIAQPFCDEEMEANYFAGRSRGAWSANKTLISHDLLHAQRTVGYNERAGGIRAEKSRYSLTPNGRQFLEALLQKNPDIQREIDAVRQQHPFAAAAPAPDRNLFAGMTGGGGGGGVHPHHRSPVRSTSSTQRRPPTATSARDEQELRDWLRTAAVGHVKEFNVGKDRRRRLHDFCDELNRTVLRGGGTKLAHESDGASRARKLFVTLVQAESIGAATVQNDPYGVAGFPDFSGDSSSSSPSRRPYSAVSGGHTLGEGSPTKVSRLGNSNDVLPPKLAAAQAALERQAVQESLRMAGAATAKTPKLPRQQQQQRAARKVTPPTIDLLDDDDDDDDDDKKMPAIANPYRKVVNNNKAKKSSVILELDLDSDSDDELPESIFQKSSQRVAAKRDLQFGKQDAKRANGDDDDDDDVVDLTESQESTAFLPADCAKPATKQQNKRTLEWDSDSDDDDDDDELPESILNNKTVRPPAAAVQRQRSVAASSSASAKPTVVVQGQPQLTVYIDDRERNRNHTPRTLRLELTRLLSSGSLAMVWPKCLPQAAVEERNLKSGDFAYAVTMTHGAALSKNGETSPLPIVVERKRIGDLVQRSFRKDHWYQLQRMQAEAAARNDNGGICVLLLEGDCRTASQYTAYGAQEVQSAPSAFDHTIDDEDTLYRFMGRAILSDRSNSTRFVQAKEEQGSLRAVGALGLMSVAQFSANSKTDNGRSVDATAERTFLKDRLQKGGLPWELASRIADEIRSVQQMDALYASIDDETFRDLLFVPLLEDLSGRIKFDGTAHGWSRAVHRIWFSALPDPKVGRQRFDELLCLAEDHALLLDKLHTGLPPEEAMDELLSAQQLLKEDLPRTVSIELPKEHQGCFPSDSTDGRAKFFRLKVTTDEQQTIPVVTMQTKSGAFSSSRLFVNLLDGTEVVRRLQESFVDGNESIVVARQVALQLKQDLGSSRRVVTADDKTVLLIRGMGNALDQAAKKTGFRSEIRVLGKSSWL